jgi:putative transposase
MLTYEFKLRPNPTQETALWKTLRLSRELYNSALEELVENFKSTGKHMNLFTQDKKHGSKEHPEIPAVVVDTTLKRLHVSFANFFRRCKQGADKKGFPRFKGANRWHSIQFRDATSNGISDSYFKAGKMLGGRIRFNRHRDIKGTLKFCRILHKPSGWYLQAVCETQSEKSPKTGASIGLDFGLKYLVADSNGEKVENPRHLKNSLRALRIAQRTIARRKKGSKRRKKAANRAARLHERVANQRKDYLHKVARGYVNRYDNIFIEDLAPSNMVKNRVLARSISDASWAMLRQLLESKAASAGKLVIAVPAHYTSQLCSQCGEIVQKALSVRTHVCPQCGYSDCRDINAAKVIFQRGSDRAVREGVLV